MEALVVVVIAIALTVIIGVPLQVIALVLMGIIGAGFAVLSLFFVYCSVRILRSEKKSASVSEIKRSERFDYPTAYYEVDGNIYANAFPCELIMRKKLYRKGRECRVYFCRRRNKEPIVYDPNAVLSTFAGLFLSLVSAVFITLYVLSMLKDNLF